MESFSPKNITIGFLVILAFDVICTMAVIVGGLSALATVMSAMLGITVTLLVAYGLGSLLHRITGGAR